MLTLKELFQDKTKNGNRWGYSSDDGYSVIGEVFQDDKWIGVSWIRDSSGNLFSQSSRAYDIDLKVPKKSYDYNPGRILNSQFIISQNKDAIVFYTVEMQAQLLLAGTAYSKVSLYSNGVLLCSVQNLLTMTLLLGITETSTQQKVLSACIPAGNTVELISELSGNATADLVGQMEVLL